MIASQEAVYGALQEINLEDLLRRLQYYAYRKLSKYGDYLLGTSPEDLVHEAFWKALDGTRKWKPHKVDMFGFLAAIIRSDISTILRGSSLALTSSVDDLESFSIEVRHDFRVEMKEILAQLDDDKIVQRCAKYIMRYESCKPRELAESMAIPVNSINNAMKRLRRRVSFGY